MTGEVAKRDQEIRSRRIEIAEDTKRHEAMEKRLYDAEMALSDTKAELVSLRIRNQTGAMGGGDGARKAMAAFEAEKQTLTDKLAALEESHAALAAENAELRRVAGADWESDRRTTEHLRERLDEIAVSVVRLANGDGALPPVAAGENGKATTATVTAAQQQPAQPPTAPGSDGRTLAERLRALQHAGALRRQLDARIPVVVHRPSPRLRA